MSQMICLAQKIRSDEGAIIYNWCLVLHWLRMKRVTSYVSIDMNASEKLEE